MRTTRRMTKMCLPTRHSTNRRLLSLAFLSKCNGGPTGPPFSFTRGSSQFSSDIRHILPQIQIHPIEPN